MRAISVFVAAIGCTVVSGCGAVLPQPDLMHPIDVQRSFNDDFDSFVRRIADHVACEIGFAADSLYISDPKDRRYILKDWAAKVELDINATETGGLNPGLSTFTQTSSFVFGLNGKLETQGVNNVSLTYFLPFDQVMTPGPHTSGREWKYGCDLPSDKIREPIEGTLGIQSILAAGFGLYNQTGFVGNRLKSGPFDTISKTVSFQVTMGASANPAWKFTNVSYVAPGPLVQASRVSMNKLVITMGPSTLGTHTVMIDGKKRKIHSVSGGASSLDESFFIERLKGALRSRQTE